MRPRNSLLLAALAACLAAPAAEGQAVRAAAAGPPAAPAAATSSAEADSTAGVSIYRREVFRYQRGGRPDPFAPLLSAAELGFRVEDLRLTSIVYSPVAGRSFAVFADADTVRRYRLHVGQRLGTMTVVRIYPQRVDVRVDEFGGSRVETIQLKRAERRAEREAAGQQPAAGAQVPVQIVPAAPAEPERRRPLRRGNAPPAGQGQTRPQSARPQQQPNTGFSSTTYGSRPRD